MRNYNSTFHVKNGLTGVIAASGTGARTLQGNIIDTIGFNDMLAVLCVGALQGSGATGQMANLTVKIQESATAGTNWSDIDLGALNGTAGVYGSATFDVLAVVASSVAYASGQWQRKMYIRANDGIRKRYFRVNASIAGTAGRIGQWSISVPIILGRPVDSNYIIDAVSETTSIQTEWGAILAMTAIS